MGIIDSINFCLRCSIRLLTMVVKMITGNALSFLCYQNKVTSHYNSNWRPTTILFMFYKFWHAFYIIDVCLSLIPINISSNTGSAPVFESKTLCSLLKPWFRRLSNTIFWYKYLASIWKRHSIEFTKMVSLMLCTTQQLHYFSKFILGKEDGCLSVGSLI